MEKAVIGFNAGRVWRYLKDRGEADINKMCLDLGQSFEKTVHCWYQSIMLSLLSVNICAAFLVSQSWRSIVCADDSAISETGFL